jgi:hypothetical protein
VGSGIAGLDAERILERDERRQRPVAPVGAEREARRWPLREVGERDTGGAVGHRLQQDRGVARRLPRLQLVEAQPALHGVPHLVGQDHQHARGPVGAQDLGDEPVRVPHHRIGRRAVERLALHVGGRRTHGTLRSPVCTGTNRLMSRQGRPNAAGNWARQYSCSAATAVGATSASATGAAAMLAAPAAALG